MDHKLIQGLVVAAAVAGVIIFVLGQEACGQPDNVQMPDRSPTGVSTVLLFHKGRPGWVDSITSSDYDTILFQAPNGAVVWEGTTEDYRRLVENYSLTITADEVNEQLKTVFGQSMGE